MNDLSPEQKRIYRVSDLYDGLPRDRAEAHPEAWESFSLLMAGCEYSMEALTDAWLFFLEGWIRGAKSGIEYA